MTSEVWEILPSAFDIGQYFLNFGETISNSDLNASHCLYIVIPNTSSQNVCMPLVEIASRHTLNRNTVQCQRETLVPS